MSTRILNETSVTADADYLNIQLSQDPRQNQKFTIQVVWGALTGTKDATLQMITSEDGTNFDTIGTAVTMDSDNDSTTFEIEHYDNLVYKLSYTKNSVSNITTLKAYTSLPSTIVTAV